MPPQQRRRPWRTHHWSRQLPRTALHLLKIEVGVLQEAAGGGAPSAAGPPDLDDPDDAGEWVMELLDEVLLRVDMAVDAGRAALRVRGP